MSIKLGMRLGKKYGFSLLELLAATSVLFIISAGCLAMGSAIITARQASQMPEVQDGNRTEAISANNDTIEVAPAQETGNKDDGRTVVKEETSTKASSWGGIPFVAVMPIILLVLAACCTNVAKEETEDSKAISSRTLETTKVEEMQESKNENSQDGSRPKDEHNDADNYVTEIMSIQDILDGVKDEEMHRKVCKLKDTVDNIAVYVAVHPDKADRLENVMHIYVPSILKFLDFYLKLESQKSSIRDSDTFRKTHQNIVNIVDKSVLALNNQLDDCYQDEAMDIIAEVKTLEQMMRMRGLLNDLSLPRVS